jgi:hypothetical protein
MGTRSGLTASSVFVASCAAFTLFMFLRERSGSTPHKSGRLVHALRESRIALHFMKGGAAALCVFKVRTVRDGDDELMHSCRDGSKVLCMLQICLNGLICI